MTAVAPQGRDAAGAADDPAAALALALPAPARVRLSSLAQMLHPAEWQITLAHALPHHRLIWLTRGQGRAVIAGRQVGLGPHSALYLPAGSLCALDLARQSYGLVLDLPAGAGAGPGAEAWPPAPDPARPASAPVLLRIRDAQGQSELTGHLDAIAREERAADAQTGRALDALAQLVLVWLERQMSLQPPATPGPAARLVARYTALVANPRMAGASMAELAARLEVSPTHLNRCCRQLGDQTAASLLISHNLWRARMLVERTDLPLKQISRVLGFGSAAYFSRFILAHTRQPPSALRKQATPRQMAKP